jgi:hypothetical protein
MSEWMSEEDTAYDRAATITGLALSVKAFDALIEAGIIKAALTTP